MAISHGLLARVVGGRGSQTRAPDSSRATSQHIHVPTHKRAMNQKALHACMWTNSAPAAAAATRKTTTTAHTRTPVHKDNHKTPQHQLHVCRTALSPRMQCAAFRAQSKSQPRRAANSPAAVRKVTGPAMSSSSMAQVALRPELGQRTSTREPLNVWLSEANLRRGPRHTAPLVSSTDSIDASWRPRHVPFTRPPPK